MTSRRRASRMARGAPIVPVKEKPVKEQPAKLEPAKVSKKKAASKRV